MILQFLSLLVPHYFRKEPLYKITDPGLLAAIKKVKNTSSGMTAAQKALDILAERFTSKRFETFIFFYLWLEKDPNTLWQRTGFMHCTQQNYLARVLLVESGKVPDTDIKLGYSFIWYFSPHQYLKVKIDNAWIALDPWNYGRGATLGKYASGFEMRKLKNYYS